MKIKKKFLNQQIYYIFYINFSALIIPSYMYEIIYGQFLTQGPVEFSLIYPYLQEHWPNPHQNVGHGSGFGLSQVAGQGLSQV